MGEEEKFECVFGYGDCPVRAMMANEQREMEAFMKTTPFKMEFKDVPPKVAADLNIFMQAMMAPLKQMSRAIGGLRDVGPFCVACPKAIRGKAQVIKEFQDDVEARKQAGMP